MKLFSCPTCGQRLYFENSCCLECGTQVLYDPPASRFVALGPDAIACANADGAMCNWRAADGNSFCRACALNRTIPDLSLSGNRDRWIRVEAAKRRLVYALLAFSLPVGPKTSPGDETGIAFDFLAPQPGSGPGGEHILTGHESGLITLNVAEADSVERERMRVSMGEAYRTLLGHFRHEIGHYYWDILIRDDPARLESFRAVFGDERLDYAQALADHYSKPQAEQGWDGNFISAYAAAHPWEDWAETWAHYLHIVDTLEMAEALNMSIGALQGASGPPVPPDAPSGADDGGGQTPASPAGHRFDDMLKRWIILSSASNSINRCMGLPDLYPFVISQAVAGKLAFVDELLRGPH